MLNIVTQPSDVLSKGPRATFTLVPMAASAVEVTQRGLLWTNGLPNLLWLVRVRCSPAQLPLEAQLQLPFKIWSKIPTASSMTSGITLGVS